MHTYKTINSKEKINYSEELLFKRIKELNYLIEQYEKSKTQSDKIKLKNEIHLFKYWMNSFNIKNTTQKVNIKVLKLGKHIIKENKRTTN